MSDKVPPRIPAGMRDILPEDMIKRRYVMNIVELAFERFGFEPLQTSAVEATEVLTGKYGPDAERLIYKAWYGEEPNGDYSLRYDLSVPLARLAAMYPELPYPFKRYQIAPVWRADRPAKGRYREFYQCDADIIGSDTMMADAEIVALIYTILIELGFTDFTIAINNRKVLDGIGQYAGVPAELQAGLYRSIDKLDKIGIEGVRNELMMVGIPRAIFQPLQRVARLVIQDKLDIDDIHTRMVEQENLDEEFSTAILPELEELVSQAKQANIPPGELQAATRELVLKLNDPLRDYYGRKTPIIPSDVITRLLELIQISGDTRDTLAHLGEHLTEFERAQEGIKELRELIDNLDSLGVPPNVYQISFSMVRGLEYYTGSIFETTIEKPRAMPSITGGGRYDELIGLFADNSVPAVGTSFGIERIIDAMDELDMFPSDIRNTTADALVTIFNAETASDSLKLATKLRSENLNTSVYFDYSDRLGDQIGYASAKGIPFVLILGPDEIAAGKVTIRKLGATRQESEERTIPLGDAGVRLKDWLSA